MIRGARTGDASAIERIFREYHPAVVRFIRSEGYPEADAEDIGQEVFRAVCSKKFLEKVDASKGRFRSLVLAVTRNMIRLDRRRRATLKRGGDRAVVSLEEAGLKGLEPEVPDVPPDLRDEKFDTFWVQSLLAGAMKSLRKECEEKGNRFYEALSMYVNGRSYAGIAAALGAEVPQVKSWIHQARSKLKRLVERRIMDYAGSLDEYEREVQYLLRYLRR